MRTARRDGQPLRRPKTRLTIDDYWKIWWSQEVTVGKARGTQKSYKDKYAAHIGPRIGHVKLRHLIDDPQLLVDWRTKLARDRGQSALEHAQRVLSSMLSAAAEEGVIPHNPLLLLNQRRRRGRARTLAPAQPKASPVAVDLTAWFLLIDYLRRPTRPPVKGDKLRKRRYSLDVERDALIVAIGFMAGYRLPSEALGLTLEDVHTTRLYMEGRSSEGEYTPGSKTGPGRDLPLRAELAAEFERVERAYRDEGQALEATNFWISARRDGGVWTEHMARNWRAREFRPVARHVAAEFPQFADLARATPYSGRHTFVSCCLQAGISLAAIADWCGTSIQMISQTYGRMIRRYEGSPPISLDDQFRTAKQEAAVLLAESAESTAAQDGRDHALQDGSVGRPKTPGASGKLRPVRRRNRAE
jgi:integrase